MSDEKPANSAYLVKWILGGLGAAFLAGATAWAQAMYSETSELRADMNARGERIGKVETSLGYLENRLSRIENKIDKLIEGK